MQSLRALINTDELVVAPLVLNPIMARLARDCGFKSRSMFPMMVRRSLPAAFSHASAVSEVT